MSIEAVILGAGCLLVVSVLASKVSERLGIPALLLFLAIGMLAGSDGPGGVEFDYPRAAQSLGVVALAFILFAGGLETRWDDVRAVWREGLLLSTFGVAVTAGLTGWFAAVMLGLPLPHGLLFGAVVSSTDAAAVFAVLRSRSSVLRSRLGALLEIESGSNDPMAVLLVIGLIRLIQEPATTPGSLALLFFRQMLIGAAAGYGAGKLMPVVLNRLRLRFEGLLPVLTIAMVLTLYGATGELGGNGFLAVYLAGILMGNSKILQRRSLVRFHDGLAWLMQIAMFLTLGLQVFPSRLSGVAWSGVALALFLMLVARPAAVFLTLAFSRLGIRERTLLSWVGLRGAAPIVLATFPLVAGIPRADLMFHIVFFIVLASALIQGTTFPLVARALGLTEVLAGQPSDLLELLERGGRDVVELDVHSGSAADGKRVVDLPLPPGALLVLVTRGGGSLVPRGATLLEGGDKVMLLAATAEIEPLRKLTGNSETA